MNEEEIKNKREAIKAISFDVENIASNYFGSLTPGEVGEVIKEIGESYIYIDNFMRTVEALDETFLKETIDKIMVKK